MLPIGKETIKAYLQEKINLLYKESEKIDGQIEALQDTLSFIKARETNEKKQMED